MARERPDIAFLLLVLFLVTTLFPKDRGLGIVLPSEPQDVPAANVLHVLIHASGIVEVRRGESPWSQRITPDRVEVVWRRETASNPRLIAAVKTASDAPYGLMVEALDRLHLAGADPVSLQVLN